MKENKYFCDMAKLGRKKAFSSPQELWDFACEYFKWVEENPWMKKELIRGGELAGAIIDIPTTRPFSWSGFHVFLQKKGIISDLDNYRMNTDNAYTEFLEVLDQIQHVMFSQKFEGASVGAFNANIIARDLQLVEKSDVTVNDKRKQIGDLFPPEEELDEAEDK